MTEQGAPDWMESSTAARSRAAGTTFKTKAPNCGARSTRTLYRSLRAPAEARRFVEEQICVRHNTAAIASVALVASEVVTHAVLRGEGPVSITLECDVTSLTLSVSCWMGAASETGEPHLGDHLSRVIIDSVCRASGTEHTEHELTMWCTIAGQVPQGERVTG